MRINKISWWRKFLQLLKPCKTFDITKRPAIKIENQYEKIKQKK